MLSKLNLLDTYTPDERKEYEMDMHQQRQEKEDAKNMGAAGILKLIETVDPSDTAKLEEIDLAVSLLIGLIPDMEIKGKPYFTEQTGLEGLNEPHEIFVPVPQYTRSRDEIKGLRKYIPGWGLNFITWQNANLYTCQYDHASYGLAFCQPIKTEELAELWCIVKAIEYDRNRP